MSERQLQDAVLRLAGLLRWRCYHTHDSRRSHAGFPDLVLIRPPRCLFVELKSAKGRVRPEQEAWLCDLSGCEGVESALWRPSDWLDGTIEAALR